MQNLKAVVQKAGDVAVGLANAAVSIEYPAIPGKQHMLYLIDCSYSGTPTGGNLHVHRGDNAVPGTVVLDLDITGTFMEVGYHMPVAGNPGEPMTLTLAAGGAGVIGKISVEHYLG